MPAITFDGDEPDEQTREYVEADPGEGTMIVAPDEQQRDVPELTDAAAEPAEPRAKRVWLVLIVIVLLLLVAAAIVWWLVR
jgi:hypothetical protein